MRPTLFATLALALSLSWLALSRPAHGAILAADGTTCTLADAIVAANTNTATGGCAAGDDVDDTIVLGADVVLAAVDASSSDVEGGQSGLPDVTADLRILAGQARVIQRDPGLGCDDSTGDPTFRFLYLAAGTLRLEGLSFEDGCFVSSAEDVAGGALLSAFGTDLVLTDSWIRRHGVFATAGDISGGIVGNGGATWTIIGGGFEDIVVEAAGLVNGGVLGSLGGQALTVAGSQFLGIGVTAGGSVAGGVIAPLGLTLTDALFSDLEVVAGGLVSGGAINTAPDDVRIERTRFTQVTVTAVGDVSGGALRSIGPLVLADTTIENVAASSTEGLCNGGGLFAVTFGAGLLERLIVRNNSCQGVEGCGGGVGLTGESIVRDSLFEKNRLVYTAGGGIGGGLDVTAPVTIQRSAFARNEVVPADGATGGDALGGGLRLTNQSTLANVTFAGNRAVGADAESAASDGGDAEGGALYLDGSVDAHLSHVTFEGNAAVAGPGAMGFADGEARGGGVYVKTETALELDNSILTGNTVSSAAGTTAHEDCFSAGTFTSSGYNLVLAPDASCDFSAAGDLVGLDPGLYETADYGCETPLPDGTCVLAAAIDQESPALDWGSCAESGATDDARAFERPVDVAGVSNQVDACDVGAFEAQDGDGDGITDVADPCPEDSTNACAIFADDFESGDTSAWSSSAP